MNQNYRYANNPGQNSQSKYNPNPRPNLHFPLHPPQQIPATSQPLPTHHPLQQLQWNYQDQQHSTWQLEKYNRLQDLRKQPMTVERGPNDRLVIQFKDELNKMICIYHNYHELESFCIHPLLFSHDLVTKDSKLLFCIKDQMDGSNRYKFRVKFLNADDVLAFCATVAGYVSIKSYEEWGARNSSSHSDLMNLSICSDNSSLSARSSMPPAPTPIHPPSTLPSQVLKQLNSDGQWERSSIAEYGPSGKLISPRITPLRARSVGTGPTTPRAKSSQERNVGTRGGGQREAEDGLERVKRANAATQTDDEPAPARVVLGELVNENAGDGDGNKAQRRGQPAAQNGKNIGIGEEGQAGQGIVNVHVSNLLSVEAVRELGRVLVDAVKTCIAAQHQLQPPPPAVVTVQKSRQKKTGTQQQQRHAVAMKQAALPPPQPAQSSPKAVSVLSHVSSSTNKSKPGQSRKRARSRKPSDWAMQENEQKLKELLRKGQEDKKKHRRSSASSPYFLRSSVADDDEEEGQEMVKLVDETICTEEGGTEEGDVTMMLDATVNDDSVVADSDQSFEL